jgi:hypothetical protein
VNKRVLTGASIGSASNIYGDTVRSGAVDLTTANKISGDVLGTGTASVVSTTADFSNSGNLKANTYNQTLTGLNGADAGNYDFSGVTSTATYTVSKKKATVSATPTRLDFNGGNQTQSPAVVTDVLAGDNVTINGLANGTAVGSYASNLIADGNDADNYDFKYQNDNLVIVPSAERLTPVVPVPAPAPSNNTVVVAGGNNSFQLAGAEAACSADTLNQCECETATNPEGVALEGIQICYEPNTRPSSAL